MSAAHPAPRGREPRRLRRQTSRRPRERLSGTLRRAAELLRDGKLAEAEAACREAATIAPEDPKVLHLSGIVAHQSGDVARADELVTRALAARPGDKTFHNSLGIVRLVQGRHEEAVAAHRRAVELDPGFPEGHFNLGNALAAAGRHEAALAAFDAALDLRPDHVPARLNIGSSLVALGRLDAALAAFERIVRETPELLPAWLHAANVHLARGDRPAALGTLQRYREQRPDRFDGSFQLGFFHGAGGEHAEAIAAYQEAIRRQPDSQPAHLNLSMSLLGSGAWEEGWKEYEWRWQAGGATPAKAGVERPVWDGSPLAGRRILLAAEQGLGDTIHFIRYAELVAARGGVVVAECARPLARLLATCPGVREVIVAGEGELPDVDVQIPLLSLPRLFGTTPDTVPARIPYLTPPEEVPAEVRAALAGTGDALKVGLVWAGNPCFPADGIRSCPLGALTPLAEVPGVRLFGLLFGPRAAELVEHPELGVVDLSPWLGDLATTAAVVRCLDLVVTVDTSMAHLAGALGEEVWTLLCAQPDWRWLQGREDTPWYPTMRLLRQARLGDWAELAGRMAGELARRAGERRWTK